MAASARAWLARRMSFQSGTTTPISCSGQGCDAPHHRKAGGLAEEGETGRGDCARMPPPCARWRGAHLQVLGVPGTPLEDGWHHAGCRLPQPRLHITRARCGALHLSQHSEAGRRRPRPPPEEPLCRTRVSLALAAAMSSTAGAMPSPAPPAPSCCGTACWRLQRRGQEHAAAASRPASRHATRASHALPPRVLLVCRALGDRRLTPVERARARTGPAPRSRTWPPPHAQLPAPQRPCRPVQSCARVRRVELRPTDTKEARASTGGGVPRASWHAQREPRQLSVTAAAAGIPGLQHGACACTPSAQASAGERLQG